MRKEELRQESVSVLGMSVRTTNALEERGIYTVDDLLRRTSAELLKITNIGENTLVEIYRCLAEHDFHRVGHEPPPPGESEQEIRRRDFRRQFGLED